jgi:hypothetical protein
MTNQQFSSQFSTARATSKLMAVASSGTQEPTASVQPAEPIVISRVSKLSELRSRRKALIASHEELVRYGSSLEDQIIGTTQEIRGLKFRAMQTALASRYGRFIPSASQCAIAAALSMTFLSGIGVAISFNALSDSSSTDAIAEVGEK